MLTGYAQQRPMSGFYPRFGEQHVRRQAAAPSAGRRRGPGVGLRPGHAGPQAAAAGPRPRDGGDRRGRLRHLDVERRHVGGRDPRRDGGPVPRRRVERPERPHRVGHRARRHPFELRGRERPRRGRSDDPRADPDRPRGRWQAVRWRSGLRVALHAGRRVLPLLAERAERELPPRRAGRRLRRPGAFHQRLPRLLRRTLAARPLRGLRRPGGDRRREQCDRHLPGRAAEGGLRPGVRPQRIPGVGGEPRPAQPGRRQRLRRRRRAPASSRRPPATRARGSRWRSPCRWTRPPLRRRPAGQGVVHRPERPADERCRPVAGVAIVRLWPVCQNHPVAGIRRRAPWKTSCTPCSRTTPRNRPYRARRQHPRRPQPARRPRAGADRRDPGAGLVGSPRPHWPSRPL